MPIYRVTISHTFNDVYFDFNNWDDAVNFMGMVVEYGVKKNKDGEHEAMRATIEEVSE